MAEKNTCNETLSEGELVSSDSEGDNMDEEMASTSKGKGSEDDENNSNMEEDENEWTVVTEGPPPRKRKNSSTEGENKKKKKKRKRATEEIIKVVTEQSSKRFLNNEQKSLLRLLCQLVSVASPDTGGPATIFKTTDVQAVIRQLVLGDPTPSSRSLKRAVELKKKRILTIWLSLVSKEDFFSSDGHFKRLKALQPTVGFSILNPGTEKFVRMGLEAFLEVEDPNKPSTPHLPPIPKTGFNKFHCVMSLENQILHGFPTPSKVEPNEQVTLPDGFIQVTTWPETLDETDISTYPMFSIDCEMVETSDGKSSLARIAVIDEDLKCVYNMLVKPSLPITDYRTRFSGISMEMLKDVDHSLVDVQQKLKELLPAKCILIGHSLDNDLNVIKMCHPYVIDTSVLFSPNATPTSKPGLKQVTKKVLDLSIQLSTSGHDPTEDAMACMKLVKKKLIEGRKLSITWRENKTSIINVFDRNSIPVSLVDKTSIINLYGRGVANGCVSVDNDDLAVEEASEQVLDSKFTFVQLHGMELYRKRDSEHQDTASYLAVLDTLDEHICELIGRCCQDTLVLVMCGSGYITEVRRLQTAVPPDLSALKKEVEKARTGYTVGFLK